MTNFNPPANPDMFQPRYTQIATFMRTPLAQSLADVDIGLVGVPYDGALTNRPGARHGPREVRNHSSLMRKFHHVTRDSPYDKCQIADVGDVEFSNILDIEGAMDDITKFYRLLADANVIPLSVGGDHSITLPIMRAIAKEPLALIHVDAHTDTWDSFQGSKFHHGSPFLRAAEENLIDPKKTIQIGIHGAQNSKESWANSLDMGMRVVFVEEVFAAGIPAIIEEARALVGDLPVYFSFDIDALDPVYAPGTGTPEIGGMTSVQALQLIRGLNGLDYIGGDVVEVSPPFDLNGITSLTAATIMYEMLCILADSHASADSA
jgi:guanidinopropionase